MEVDQPPTEELLRRASQNDKSALNLLFDKHRARLRRMVAARLDRRITARIDPSDIVNDSLVDAYRRLPDYLRDRPIAFFPWLRCLTLQQLVGTRRVHLLSAKRSTLREVAQPESTDGRLVDRLAGTETSAIGHVLRAEERRRVREAVETLACSDREVLQLRYVEHLPFAEIASRLELGLGAVKMRHLRAIKRFGAALEASEAGPLAR